MDGTFQRFDDTYLGDPTQPVIIPKPIPTPQNQEHHNLVEKLEHAQLVEIIQTMLTGGDPSQQSNVRYLIDALHKENQVRQDSTPFTLTSHLAQQKKIGMKNFKSSSHNPIL